MLTSLDTGDTVAHQQCQSFYWCYAN